MKKIVKLLLIIGLSLTLLGGVVFLVGFGLTGFNIYALGNIKIAEKQYVERTENPVTAISLDFDIADFKVVFDDNAEGLVINYPQRQNKKGKNLTTIQIIETENAVQITEKSKPFLLSVFNFVSPTVTLTLPTTRAYDLSIRSDTGDISVLGKGVFSSLYLEADTGDITAATIACEENVKIETDTGDVTLGDFDVNNLSISVDTGDVCLTSGRANLLSIETDTGDFSLLGMLTLGSLHIETDTGDVEAAKGAIDADSVIISTDTGDISANLVGKQSDYAITVEHDTGDTNISSNLGSVTNPTRVLKIETDTGDIYISFTEN